MVSGRPLLYLSLPGVAFILGVFWFRRRNKNRIDDGSTDDDAAKKPKVAGEEKIQKSHANGTVNMANGKLIQNGSGGMQQTSNAATAPAMNINGSIPTDEKESPTTKLFGKSAPIKIQNNGRVSPGKQQQIDSEILKTKIQDAEQKLLRSIDEDFENMSSPVDLPDSVNNRTSFYTRTAPCQVVEPVVIKATRTPKISPENSFLESKYTHKECEQNNNCGSIAECDSNAETNADVPAAFDKTKASKKDAEQQKQPQQTTVVGSKDLDDAVKAANQKRNVDSASPSLSLCSVQSGDSGKGSSLPRSEATRGKITYAFYFPIGLIGQLYGRKRAFINSITAKTLANVTLGKSVHYGKMRVCTVEGAESEINAALGMIRKRMPLERYPNFTMYRIHYALPQTIVPLSNESLHNLQLKLIEGINNDVVVSVVEAGGHLFVQQPFHPSHPALPVLQRLLNESYAGMDAPMLPGIEVNAVCVLLDNDVWYRVQIVDTDPRDAQSCVVKFLDFGGYMLAKFEKLRQIRADFLTVPFQSTECMLSNIEPIGTHWLPEAADILFKITKGIVLQAQVAGYNSHNIPEIYLFANLGPNNVIFINKELVARNLARWVEARD